MNRVSRFAVWVMVLTLWLGYQGSALACATCFGAPDAPLTKGLNWGIGSLLVMILMVLGGVASFFIYLMRRAASMPAPSVDTGLTEATGKAN